MLFYKGNSQQNAISDCVESFCPDEQEKHILQ